MKKTRLGVLVLLLLAAPAAMQAQLGSGDGFNYRINAGNANTITITGYAVAGGPVGSLAIPTNINGLTVTSIGSSAFDDCTAMTGVAIPDTVTNIESFAFYFCTFLTNVTMPGSVTSIGESAFLDCFRLPIVTIPASVTNIGGGPFAYCSSLTAIAVNPSNSAFVSIAGVLFNQSQTALIQYPAGKAGTSYTIPNSVTNIGEGAFYGCQSLSGVTIPGGVTRIGGFAFDTCIALTTVTIPSSVTNIGEGPFSECISLMAITVNPSNPDYISVAGVLLNQTQTALIQYPAGKVESAYSIPGSVTNIGGYSFVDCTSLTSVMIGNGVASIGNWAFAYCFGLTNVTVGRSVAGIGIDALFECTNLAGTYFAGNAPIADSSAFDLDTKATVYYLPGTTGWSSNFTSRPAVIWNPLIQAGGPSFGVKNNQYGFNIIGTNNFTVAVEACTNLASPVWIALQTLTLSNGVGYFSDPQWRNYPCRFYGLGFP